MLGPEKGAVWSINHKERTTDIKREDIGGVTLESYDEGVKYVRPIEDVKTSGA